MKIQSRLIRHSTKSGKHFQVFAVKLSFLYRFDFLEIVSFPFSASNVVIENTSGKSFFKWIVCFSDTEAQTNCLDYAFRFKPM